MARRRNTESKKKDIKVGQISAEWKADPRSCATAPNLVAGQDRRRRAAAGHRYRTSVEHRVKAHRGLASADQLGRADRKGRGVHVVSKAGRPTSTGLSEPPSGPPPR